MYRAIGRYLSGWLWNCLVHQRHNSVGGKRNPGAKGENAGVNRFTRLGETGLLSRSREASGVSTVAMLMGFEIQSVKKFLNG